MPYLCPQSLDHFLWSCQRRPKPAHHCQHPSTALSIKATSLFRNCESNPLYQTNRFPQHWNCRRSMKPFLDDLWAWACLHVKRLLHLITFVIFEHALAPFLNQVLFLFLQISGHSLEDSLSSTWVLASSEFQQHVTLDSYYNFRHTFFFSQLNFKTGQGSTGSW